MPETEEVVEDTMAGWIGLHIQDTVTEDTGLHTGMIIQWPRL